MDIQTEEASRQVSEMHRKIVKATNEVKSLKANKKQLQRFNLKAQDQVHRSKVQLLEAQSRIQELEGLLGNGGTCVVCQCEKANVAIIPCGHICLCTSCHPTYLRRLATCPVCSQSHSGAIKVYQS
mmetsp:Transcript_473/g.996  ORF Transcript_473/g.996 Transcript_473/m.996 type:complete len:126 (-) Transcript_473:477-854(-)